MAALRKIASIIVLTTVFGFARSQLDPILSPYAKSLGFSTFQISLFFAVFSLVMILMSPLIGRISDGIGRKRVILAGLLASAIALVLYTLSSSWIVFIGARVLDAMGFMSVGLIAISKLEDGIDDRQRGAFTGFSESINSVGAILGPLLGGFIADYYTVKMPFFTAAFITLLLFFFVLFWKEPPKRALQLSDINFIQSLAKFLKIRELRAIALLGFFMYATIPVTYIFIPLMIVEEFHKPYSYVGYFLVAYVFFNLFQFAYGKISDTMGQTPILVLGGVMSGIILILYAQTPSFGILLLLTLARSFADANWSVTTWAFISKIGEKKQFEGQVTGSYYSLVRIGSFSSYALSSLVVLYFNVQVLFVLYGVLLIAAALVAERMLAKA